MRITFQRIVVVLALIAAPGVASAQSKRTFVSGSGVDSGTCSITAPCRSFAYAVSQTAEAGELVVKDGAGYGPVTITQSITIANDGVGTASISVPGNGTGITINTSTADASVHIRGVEIDGNGAGNTGILVSGRGSVELLNCVVRHNILAGIAVQSPNVRMAITNTIVSSNYNGLSVGVTSGASENISLTIDNSKFDSNQETGILSYNQQGTTTITRTSVSFNQFGINPQGSIPTPLTVVAVRDSTIASNKYGVLAQYGSTLLSHTLVAGNTSAGLTQQGSAQLVSYGDNNINFNGTDQVGTITKYTTE